MPSAPAMAMPKPSASAIARFERLRPAGPDVSARKVFGQPAAFVRGNLFFGVFGESLFVRLPPAAASEATDRLGFLPFAPMPGRPMAGYAVLPPKVLSDPAAARRWVAKARAYAAEMPAKTPRPHRRA